MTGDALLELARKVVELARARGATEVVATVSTGVSVSVSQREERLEQASESRSTGVGLRLLVDDRFSTHGSSDLRPEALQGFVARAVEATRFLEPDPDRALPPREACGVAEVDLDLLDPQCGTVSSEQRREAVARLEAEVLARRGEERFRSCTTHWTDSRSEAAVVFSNGFEGTVAGSSFGYGAEITLEDTDGRLPEATAWYGAAHCADLPGLVDVADEAWRRVRSRMGARAAPSGRYPLLLDRQVVGRLVGVLLGPMGGGALHLGRSCLAGKLGERIGAHGFTLLDDPLIPRGAGSSTFDGDGFPSRRRVLVEQGVLRTFLLGQYHARRLGMDPTTAGTSNLLIAPGDRSPAEIAADLPRAIRVDAFLGGNSNSTTGDFSMGIRGALLERGQPVHAISEMNVAGNLFELLERYREAADDPWTWGSWRVPTLLFDDIQFSGA